VPLLPIGLLQVSSAGFAIMMTGSLVWANKTIHIKKQRDRGGVGLRWPSCGQKSNNQPIVGGNDVRGDGEGAQLGQSIWGGVVHFVQGGKLRDLKNTKIKYAMALDGCVTIFHMQQPTKNTWVQLSKITRAGATRGEHAGGMIPSFWGALEVERR
jgi:hypothetical protein